MGWIAFAAAFAVFFLTHSIPLRPPVRGWLVARLGARGFSIGYSVVSLAVLLWLIAAAGRAPRVGLWDWAVWQNHLVLTAMLAACLILSFGIARPNPFSFGGARNAEFDPARPGILRWMRHPVLVAAAIWALAHLLANGDLAHVILFGTFAGFALLGQVMIDRRKRSQMGADWARLRQAVASGPLIPRPESLAGAVMRAVAGLALYGGLLALHPYLFGAAPLP